MYVRTYFLTSLSGAKRTHDRDLGRHLTRLLRRPITSSQRGVQVSLCGLVVVDTIQAEAESVHDDMGALRILSRQDRVLVEDAQSACMVLYALSETTEYAKI